MGTKQHKKQEIIVSFYAKTLHIEIEFIYLFASLVRPELKPVQQFLPRLNLLLTNRMPI